MSVLRNFSVQPAISLRRSASARGGIVMHNVMLSGLCRSTRESFGGTHRTLRTSARIIALCCLFVPISLSAAVYYVSPQGNDTNPGTASAPWMTFYHAAQTLQA